MFLASTLALVAQLRGRGDGRLLSECVEEPPLPLVASLGLNIS
jgi:hypothetical protein